MQQVITIIFPLILMVAVGMFSVRSGILSAQLVPHFSQFLIRIALPCYLIYSLSITPLQEIWQGTYFLGYALVSLVLFIGCFFVFKARGYVPAQAAVMGFGGSMSNTGFIGTAVLTLLMGVSAIPFLAMTLIIENIIILTLMLACTEIGQPHRDLRIWLWQMLQRLSKHPIIQSIVIGILLSFLQIEWPNTLATALKTFAQTATPLALFVIGASLAHFKIQQMNRDIIALVTVKMCLMPIGMALVFYLLPNVNQDMFFAAMILAALPMASATAIYAQQYGNTEQASVAVMISTLCSLFSLSFMMYFFSPI